MHKGLANTEFSVVSTVRGRSTLRCGCSTLHCHCTLHGHYTVCGRCNLRCGHSTVLRLSNLFSFKYQPQVNLIKVANAQNVSMAYIVGYLYLPTSI